jgi:soluble lytic murein transglycosylase-like protein
MGRRTAKQLITTILAGFFLSMSGGVKADVTKSSKSQLGISSAHLKLIERRLSKEYSGSSRLVPKSSRIEIIPSYQGSYQGVFKPMAEAAARKHGVPVDLFHRLVQQESNWNHSAKSHKGAIGLAQLMPFTARKLGVDPRDPRENLEGGARYLKQQYIRFRSWRLALAAYNAGPEAVEKYNGVPPYRETKNYVRKILGQ